MTFEVFGVCMSADGMIETVSGIIVRGLNLMNIFSQNMLCALLCVPT